MINHDPLNDTSPEAEAVLISLLRRAPSWRKFKMVGDLNATVKEFALAGIQERYPNASQSEINRHLADLLLGEELAAKIFGTWDEFRCNPNCRDVKSTPRPSSASRQTAKSYQSPLAGSAYPHAPAARSPCQSPLSSPRSTYFSQPHTRSASDD